MYKRWWSQVNRTVTSQLRGCRSRYDSDLYQHNCDVISGSTHSNICIHEHEKKFKFTGATARTISFYGKERTLYLRYFSFRIVKRWLKISEIRLQLRSLHRTTLFRTSGPFFNLLEEVFVVLGAVFLFGGGISSCHCRGQTEVYGFRNRNYKKKRVVECDNVGYRSKETVLNG